ncbi:MAG: hypothetical protein ACOYT8_05530 [Candidatus Dependentiae bacterium]
MKKSRNCFVIYSFVFFFSSTVFLAMEKNNKPTIPEERSLDFFKTKTHENRLVQLGARVLWKIREDKYIAKDLDNQLADLSKAYYAIYNAASQKIGFLFNKGSIKLVGQKNFKVYETFGTYALLANPKLTGTNADWRNLVTFNKRADSRASTHFYSPEYTQYGINLEFDNSFAAELNKFPNDHQHLLFGVVSKEKDTFFFKPEEHGTHYTETPAHALGLGKSFTRKHILPIFEKIIPSFAPVVESFTGKEHDPLSRRETVNPEWIKEYNNIINNSYMNDEAKNQHIALFKKEGIQFVTQQLDHCSKTFNALIQNPKIKEYTPQEHTLTNEQIIAYHAGMPHYPWEQLMVFVGKIGKKNDNILFRQGEEVILTDKDLDKYLKETDIYMSELYKD